MGWIPEEGELGSAVLSLIPNPVDFSVRRWLVIGSVTWVFYLWHISTLSRRPRNSPCPDHGIVLRVLYGLFSTWVAEQILAHFLHTKRNEPQAEQVGGTQPVVLGPPQLRIKVVPILGAAFGGNYAYLIWDETDADRRAIVVDPADPYPVLRAAAEEKLNIEVLLTTHWHFDHASGNATFAREIPGLRVIASDREVARVPAATERMHDEQQIRVGSIVVTAHTVPGHTLGSVVYEVSSSALPESPSAAFTGDTLFCGGCGRLFEGSALQLHASLRRLRHRLKPDCQIFSGHEYVSKCQWAGPLARRQTSERRTVRDPIAFPHDQPARVISILSCAYLCPSQVCRDAPCNSCTFRTRQ